MAKVLGAIALVIAIIFGYFLQKSHWDVRLAQSMIGFEIKKLMGDDSPNEDVNAVTEESEPAKTAPVQQPNASSPTKDSMYQEGNNFSDIKRTGNESNYQPTP